MQPRISDLDVDGDGEAFESDYDVTSWLSDISDRHIGISHLTEQGWIYLHISCADGYILVGNKVSDTNSYSADGFEVLAKRDTDDERSSIYSE